MTAITWVLAADDSRARIFETRGLKLDLRQIEELRNPAPRAPQSNERDRQFARTVAEMLERSRVNHRFDRLRLAVEPRFLGTLREYLSIEIQKLVHEDASEDSAGMSARRPF
ncbi:host attachment protein [Caballeronia sp. LP006]|uniref:host attachment protein n=1 Tax=unclassified Caballeronia TaxID=2646786 RepID=UPI001FD21C8A|nr:MULTISPECIES: host attachment protein [unclassified Caballeronia]MDR5802243.1 host attachment protein [Caballeronia sp. LZ001]MDR5828379.1 host attachment protein [Caballeronia sp. LP006]